MPGVERSHQGDQIQIRGQPLDHPETQPATEQPTQRCHLLRGVFHIVEDSICQRAQRLPSTGEMHAPTAAHEERGAELRLQPGDLRAERRQCDETTLRCPCDVLGLGDGQEVLQLTQLHDRPAALTGADAGRDEPSPDQNVTSKEACTPACEDLGTTEYAPRGAQRA